MRTIVRARDVRMTLSCGKNVFLCSVFPWNMSRYTQRRIPVARIGLAKPHEEFDPVTRKCFTLSRKTEVRDPRGIYNSSQHGRRSGIGEILTVRQPRDHLTAAAHRITTFIVHATTIVVPPPPTTTRVISIGIENVSPNVAAESVV